MVSLCGSLALIAFLPLQAWADPDGCTSIAVSPAATIEGSAFATHTNDCQTCDPRMAHIPAKDHPAGAKHPIFPIQLPYPRFVGAVRSAVYAPEPGQRDTEPLGYIDEVAHTFAYWEAGYPLINEHGLGFGESTCAAKLVGQSVADGGSALFGLPALMQIALERCRTATCAIETMGSLGQQYGFYGEDPGMAGAGESLSVADNKDAWVFHITSGLGNTSATWVAQRVPDKHVTVVSNNFIIRGVNCSDSKNFRCSSNIFSNAHTANLCDFEDEKDFDWLRCYAPDVRSFSYLAGMAPVPFYTTLRTWRVHTLANPSLPIQLSDDPYSFDFSVPVQSKISRSQVMDWMRDHYEGTPFDMTTGILAGPYGNPNRMEGGPSILQVPGQFARAISIPRTSYGLLVEAKAGSKAVQSIAWFATDVPASSVFVPFFAQADRCAVAYSRGRVEVFSRDSAWWAFNFLANWMNINYRDMSQKRVYPARDREQAHVMHEVEALEQDWPSPTILGSAQADLQNNLVGKWWQLGDETIAAFSDGVYHTPDGKVETIGYPSWWLQMIGYNSAFVLPQWVQWAETPPPMLISAVPSTQVLRQALGLAAPPHHDGPVYGFLPGLFAGVAGSTLVFSMTMLTKRRSLRSEYLPLAA